MSKRRVVVTGLGLVTPLGLGVEENWKALCEGRSGITRIDRFDVSDLASQIGGLVRDFDPGQFMEKKEIKRTDPFVQFAMASSSLAMKDSGLVISNGNADRVAVVIGSGMGGLQTLEKAHEVMESRGPERVSPFFLPMTITNLASGRVAIEFGAKGPNICIVTACSAGTHSIGQGCRLIAHGYADAAIAGGTEASVTRLSIAGFCAMRALCRSKNDSPAEGSRPFDMERDGFVIGEGAGVLILEEREHAVQRGARIYAEIVGYGESGDAYHVAAPSIGGEGATSCMKAALVEANMDPTSVDYVNAHGTGTRQNDAVETLAIKKVFGEHAYNLAVSSTKSMTGHLLGAAGAVEAVYTVLALCRGILPPTINQRNPDPDCDLDYVPNQSRKQAIRVAISNSFGFGGTNATLVFNKCQDEETD